MIDAIFISKGSGLFLKTLMYYPAIRRVWAIDLFSQKLLVSQRIEKNAEFKLQLSVRYSKTSIITNIIHQVDTVVL